ncbi:hypothetical protein HII17_08915 [Thalassotalea sp. M1531]|uniref:DUF6249 domain-containing protein n=1 Tax=Thalassotalea algicola TaxID=2716224 RepID=A0A7Y0LDK5_9GAMM|nr:DUF6249 domain-containing protein [Thalassotalea algicola]NMP31681.1 hypothetical protein [Thalassotalea algicola]
MEGLFVPIVLFICIAAVVWNFINRAANIKKDQQETLQRMIASEQPLTAEIINNITRSRYIDANDDRDLSRGIIAIFLSIAVFCYGHYGLVDEEAFTWLAVFPFFLGIAFLTLYKLKPKSA